MEMISFAQAAERLGVKVTRAHRLLNEHRLLALPDEQGKLQVVAESLLETPEGWTLVERLPGTMLTLLDGGFTVQEATEWVLAAQPLLDGQRPIDLLRAGSHSKVNSVAAMQAI
ncbi:Rv2175c family DNA-binding protein [Varibaculum cambriense]|uniref:Rv2175c family DNA-binding protein n=1 Tax=Varibaculum cambriense TaxID=184870 RepID=UPI002914054B|nr:Rv2175c family DNA-binding protein [Varibaculum cambriense]MDU5541669.1 Rv2175c family DNA-binding protein [Varibaculum cambriense]